MGFTRIELISADLLGARASSCAMLAATEDSDTSTIGGMRDDANAVPASIDFGDLDGHASEHLSSLGQSLLKLTLTPPSMSNFSDLNAEIKMENLQVELC